MASVLSDLGDPLSGRTDRPAYLLLHTSLLGLSSLFPCRSVRPRPAQEPVHPPGETTAVRLGQSAVTFLDDKLLPATSNAVERSNRQSQGTKSIYYVGK